MRLFIFLGGLFQRVEDPCSGDSSNPPTWKSYQGCQRNYPTSGKFIIIPSKVGGFFLLSTITTLYVQLLLRF